jgi:AraC-like DNA-binding protein
MRAPYISSSFLRGFSSLVLAKGGNPAKFYQSVGLGSDVMMEDSLSVDRPMSLLIPFDKFVYILENAAADLDFPDIAMQLARQQDIMLLAPLGPLLKDCQNIYDTLNTVIKYLKILVSGYQVEVLVEEKHVTLTFSMDLPHIQELVQYQDYAIASAVTVIYGLLGKSYPIRACYFLRNETNQNRLSQYARYYGCPVAFGSRSLSLTIDSAVLGQDVNHLVKQFNDRISSAITYRNRNIVDQVSQVISFSLANGASDIRYVAASMHLSSRTLQRYLNTEGTSFRGLLDSVRFNMANQYLKNTFYRLTDIAMLLGYSNLSSFSRSYQRWSGVYPREVRKQLLLQ